jgi:hypothetical protein
MTQTWLGATNEELGVDVLKNLNTVLASSKGCQYFKVYYFCILNYSQTYLEKEFSVENIDFYLAIRELKEFIINSGVKQLEQNTDAIQKIKDLQTKFLMVGSERQVKV